MDSSGMLSNGSTALLRAPGRFQASRWLACNAWPYVLLPLNEENEQLQHPLLPFL